MTNRPQTLAFTVRFNGRTNMLITKTLISTPLLSPADTINAIEPININDADTVDKAKEYVGIWDTGATNSVISQKVVDECGLKPIGIKKVHTAGGDHLCEVFLVSIFLPNKVVIPSISVTKAVSLAGCDVLIGMDIISQGDFAITHNDGKTMFSFRLPSMGAIDFVTSTPYHASIKPQRNAPCPCGSDKKYKKCCGKP